MSDTQLSKGDLRKRFNAGPAKAIASGMGLVDRVGEKYSKRFSYFADDDRFLVVAGEQEGEEIELALAYGLTYRKDRRLLLALPDGCANATLQRSPWFTSDAQPEVWLHDGMAGQQRALVRSQRDTVEEVRACLHQKSPADELRKASTGLHLGDLFVGVERLVEWATEHPLLDPGHRPKERAWHCFGQKLLSITRHGATLVIKAGVHYTRPGKEPEPREIVEGSVLDENQLQAIQDTVEAGIKARLSDERPIGRPDEHWLQATIRRDPSLVGVEQPALRELPAWRPRDDSSGWGRGFIDLVGIDGHGNIRVVETKLADNKDALLVLQGLDYYVWANLYREVLGARLGAAKESRLEVHYVVGDSSDGKIHLSPFAAAQARSLDVKIRWRFRTVLNWYRAPDDPKEAASRLLPAGCIPADG